MPYVSEGGVKFTDHHVQSPLLAIDRSCAVCHRWSEEEIRARVYAIQDKVHTAKIATEELLVPAHFDVAAAMEAGVDDEALAPVRQTLREAQFRWDYIMSNNGMGFHSPQETMRILGEASRQAGQVRLLVARMLAARGFHDAPVYPDISTREKARAIAIAFEEGKPPKLLP